MEYILLTIGMVTVFIIVTMLLEERKTNNRLLEQDKELSDLRMRVMELELQNKIK